MLQVSRWSSTGKDPRRVGADWREGPIKGVMTPTETARAVPGSEHGLRHPRPLRPSPRGLTRWRGAPPPFPRPGPPAPQRGGRHALGRRRPVRRRQRRPFTVRRSKNNPVGAGPTVRRAPRRRLRDRGQTACPPRPRRPTHGFGHRPRRPTRSKTALRLRRGPTSRAAGPRTSAASTRGFSRPTSEMCRCVYGQMHK